MGGELRHRAVSHISKNLLKLKNFKKKYLKKEKEKENNAQLLNAAGIASILINDSCTTYLDSANGACLT